MQIPIPPVSQCMKTQTANAFQENQAGLNASKAPEWRNASQIKDGQAVCVEEGAAVVEVVMITLSYEVPEEVSRAFCGYRWIAYRRKTESDLRRADVKLADSRQKKEREVGWPEKLRPDLTNL